MCFFELPRGGVTFPQSPLKSSEQRVLWARSQVGIVDQHQRSRLKCRVHTPDGEVLAEDMAAGRGRSRECSVMLTQHYVVSS